VQHSFGTIRGPTGKKDVIGSCERASSVDGYETSVSHELLSCAAEQPCHY
jgi:hypothetical protein